jgi:hypothetical protein
MKYIFSYGIHKVLLVDRDFLKVWSKFTWFDFDGGSIVLEKKRQQKIISISRALNQSGPEYPVDYWQVAGLPFLREQPFF